MSSFAIRNPYFIVVVCLIITVVGVSSLVRMPVDMFPAMNIPVVVVATFYTGMPPEQIEADITGRFERFFLMGSGIEHIESRSLPGVSLIKVYFQPGTNADSAVTTISNLAMAQLRRLPPGTLPPVVLKFDASSLPVCLRPFRGQGLTETQLRDLAQFQVPNQIGSVPGASTPPPFGGLYRQIMVYADPYKLEAHQLSLMDVVRAVNNANLILPAGDVRLGSLDYNIYTHSQLDTIADINQLPGKTVGQAPVRVGDIGYAKDAQQIQTNIVRVDGQRSVYVPVMKQGGDANTIAVVDGMREAVQHLFDVPKELVTRVAFDQSAFVKTAIETLLHEGGIGLFQICGRRHARSGPAPVRCAQGTGDAGGVRPIGVCEDGNRDAASRRRYRVVSDVAADPGFPGQHARHRRGVLLDSAFRAGGVYRARHGRRLYQQHGAGWTGAGILAAHR